MSLFWSLWIIVLTVACLVLVTWVLFANRKVAVRDDMEQENRTTGHVYDGIEEYDNPLPRWWFQLFVLTLIFTVIYLILFPGLGSFPGVLGWTQENRLEKKVTLAEARYDELYADFMAQSIEDLAEDPRALKIGVRLFSNHCAVCHSADGGGNFGFPNLTDDEWLWGGSPEAIKKSITEGREGAMPAWGEVIGESGVAATTEYVLQMADYEHDAELAEAGKPIYNQFCKSCHMEDGSGNPAFGAPGFTDDSWLYEGTREAIARSIRQGRQGKMPAQEKTLREEKIHLLTAYVYSLSKTYSE